MINGCIDKCDNTFLSSFFFEKFGETGLFFGSFPSEINHIKNLSENGITAVLNLLTPNE